MRKLAFKQIRQTSIGIKQAYHCSFTIPYSNFLEFRLHKDSGNINVLLKIHCTSLYVTALYRLETNGLEQTRHLLEREVITSEIQNSMSLHVWLTNKNYIKWQDQG